MLLGAMLAAAVIGLESQAGGACNDAADCAPEEWCKFPAGMCQADEPLGTCVISAGGNCPDVVEPVCGCNFVTYTNACYATVAEVSVLYEGDCGPPPCGGYFGLPCPAGAYCLTTEGECGVYYGLCEPAPVSCPDLCDRVCGCDGLDYASECAANLGGTTAHHLGACDSPTDGIVGGVGFDGAGNLSWSVEQGAQSYNVYRRIVASVPPAESWSCWRHGIAATSLPVPFDPQPGDAWWLDVTADLPGGEGGMGMASDCSVREPAAHCP
jgi:hypothetical protein